MNSAIAQWWSIRLLTEGLQVRVLLAEQSPKIIWGFLLLMKYFLYILKSQSADKYYVGISENPEVRLYYHNNIEKGFTSRYRPWEMVFTKEFNSKSDAADAEKKIKGWKSRVMTERIISGEVKL